MKNIEFLHLITNLFKFKTIKDSEDNEYVLCEKSICSYVKNIDDKTAFEATENHEHILRNIKKSDFEDACIYGKALGETLISCLKHTFPNKRFVVFVTVGEDLIIRFHQIWENEPLYYDVSADYGKSTKVFMLQ